MITFFFIILSLKSCAQYSTICFGDFNFFMHKEIDKKASCNDTLRVACYYNASGLYEMIDVRKIYYGSTY